MKRKYVQHKKIMRESFRRAFEAQQAARNPLQVELETPEMRELISRNAVRLVRIDDKKEKLQAGLNKAAIAWLESLDPTNYLSPDDKMLMRAVRAFQKASGGK